MTTETSQGNSPASTETPAQMIDAELLARNAAIDADENAGEAESVPAVTDTDESSGGKPPVQKRIDELTRLRREAERDRDHWRHMAQRQTPAQPPAADKPTVDKPQPTLADFNYDETKYHAALTDYIAEKTEVRVRETLAQEAAERTRSQKRNDFQKREQTFASKHADYLELTRDESLPITQGTVELLSESDTGPEVLYYLAKHRDEALAIAQMDATSAARAIGRLEAKLTVSAPVAPKPPAPVPRQVSKAPPPPPQIEAIEPQVQKDPKDWTDREFTAWRKKHQSR